MDEAELKVWHKAFKNNKKKEQKLSKKTMLKKGAKALLNLVYMLLILKVAWMPMKLVHYVKR